MKNVINIQILKYNTITAYHRGYSIYIYSIIVF